MTYHSNDAIALVVKSLKTGEIVCYDSTIKFANAIGRSDFYVADGIRHSKKVFCSKTNGEFWQVVEAAPHESTPIPQPCWSCKKSINGCTWSKSKGITPVEGWAAEPVIKDGKVWSYAILECPEYEKE